MVGLIFDGTILANELMRDSSRSGVFFVAKNLFLELLKRTDVKLALYCNLEQFLYLKRVLKLYNIENVEIINECEFNFLWNLAMKLREVKHETKGICRFTLACISECLLRLAKFLNFITLKTINLSSYDCYFSPVFRVPKCIKKCEKIKSAVYLHDVIPLIYKEFYPQMRTGKYWFVDLINSFSENEIYFANSISTKNDFLNYCPKLLDKQVSVAYPAVNSEIIAREYDNSVLQKFGIKNKYIFSLGSIEPRKNLFFVIKNFIEFINANNIDDLNLVVSGSVWSSFEEKFNQDIESFRNYKDKIIFTGYLEDNDLYTLYSQALCFVYPSLYEGFGLPVLEAMSSGCPVITSNKASMPEVIGDCGILINPINDSEIQDAYNKMYYDNEYRSQAVLKGLERAKLFNWQKCTDVILQELMRYI